MDKDIIVFYDIGNGIEKMGLKKIADHYNVDYDNLKHYYLTTFSVTKSLQKSLSDNTKKRLSLYYLKLFGLDHTIIDKLSDESKKRLLEFISEEIAKYDNDKIYNYMDNIVSYKRKKNEIENKYDYLINKTKEDIVISKKELELLLVNFDIDRKNIPGINYYSKEDKKLFNLLLYLVNDIDSLNIKVAMNKLNTLTNNNIESLKLMKRIIANKNITLSHEQATILFDKIYNGIPDIKYNKKLINLITNNKTNNYNLNKYNNINEIIDNKYIINNNINEIINDKYSINNNIKTR